MCGIVGYVGDKGAVGIIVDGLKRLEYRGYDSTGVAVLDRGELQGRRAVGRTASLNQRGTSGSTPSVNTRDAFQPISGSCASRRICRLLAGSASIWRKRSR